LPKVPKRNLDPNPAANTRHLQWHKLQSSDMRWILWFPSVRRIHIQQMGLVTSSDFIPSLQHLPYSPKPTARFQEIISSRPSVQPYSTAASTQRGIHSAEVPLFQQSLQASLARTSRRSEDGKAMLSTYISNHNPKEYFNTSFLPTRTSYRNPWHPRNHGQLDHRRFRRTGLSKERKDYGSSTRTRAARPNSCINIGI
jgi:hypothetical protein